MQHIRHRQHSGNSTTIGAKVGILGDLHPGLNSSVFSVQRCSFRFPAICIPWQSTRCRQIHLPHATVSLSQSLHSTHDMCAWLKLSSLSCTSSTHHGSSFAARDTEHFLTISFFYLPCVLFVYFSDSRPVVHASINPLRRSTAGWHFCGLSFCYPLLILVDDVLSHPMNSEIDLERVVIFDIIVFDAVSRNTLSIVVSTLNLSRCNFPQLSFDAVWWHSAVDDDCM